LPVGQNQFASLHHHAAVGGAIAPTPGIELLQKSFREQRQIAARSVRTRAWRHAPEPSIARRGNGDPHPAIAGSPAAL
jgi:hypothetical protein